MPPALPQYDDAGVLLVKLRDGTTKRLALVRHRDFGLIQEAFRQRQPVVRFRVYVGIPSSVPGQPELLRDCNVVEALFSDKVVAMNLVDLRRVDVAEVNALGSVPQQPR